MISFTKQRRTFIARTVSVTLFVGVFLFSWLHSGLFQSAPTPGVAEAQDPSGVTGDLTVFAAASLTEPFTEIGKRLESSHPGLKVAYNFGGSQALRTQLEQGAHADLFASADAAQMEQAKQSGVVQGDSPLFAKNRLVVITPKNNTLTIATLCDLAQPGAKLDLANATVPVGNYSRQALAKASAACGADFEQRVLKNIVSEEENVKQVVTKIQLGEADAGIVYVSDVSPKVSNAVQTVTIPDAYNQIAAYPIALTKDVKNHAAAKAFLAFVLSAEGQTILKAHNFLPLEE